VTAPSLERIIERLMADDLIPPVKAVEVVGGGVIRLTVTEPVGPELRARLKTAMGSVRWTIGNVGG
jgi:hypothetical protein